jgi:hypothetical protein
MATEFDVWLNDIVVDHKMRAARGEWDGKQITEYYTECRKLHLKQGLCVIMTRDVGYSRSGRFSSALLDRCFNLSVASFSPISMMPEAQRQDLAVQIVRRMFWPSAKQVWVQKPNGVKGSAGDIWNYLLFCDSRWNAQQIGASEQMELMERGLVPFGVIQNQVSQATGVN